MRLSSQENAKVWTYVIPDRIHTHGRAHTRAQSHRRTHAQQEFDGSRRQGCEAHVSQKLAKTTGAPLWPTCNIPEHKTECYPILATRLGDHYIPLTGQVSELRYTRRFTSLPSSRLGETLIPKRYWVFVISVFHIFSPGLTSRAH